MINFFGDYVPFGKVVLSDRESIGSDSVNCLNLECAITNEPPLSDKGTLVLEPEQVSLPEISNLVFNLANNHIHDAGPSGIVSTIDFCEENKIGFFGAGCNLSQAQAPFEVEGYSLVGFCEKNDTYLKNILSARDDSPGVNVLTIENIKSTIGRITDSKVIVVVHWSVEHVQSLPSHLKKLLDQITAYKQVIGVIGHHPHVPHAPFVYNGVPVYSSLGNFYFPGFVIKPPVQACFFREPLPKKLPVTYHYHKVLVDTEKKWKKINDTSLMVTYRDNSFEHTIIRNQSGEIIPSSLPGLVVLRQGVLRGLGLWSNGYSLFHKAEKKIIYIYWRAYNFLNRNIFGVIFKKSY